MSREAKAAALLVAIFWVACAALLEGLDAALLWAQRDYSGFTYKALSAVAKAFVIWGLIAVVRDQ